MWCSSCVFHIPETKLLIHQLAVYPSGPAFLRLKQEQKQDKSFTLYWQKRQRFDCHMLTRFTSPQTRHRRTCKAIRHASGRHPLFTGKPLEAALMHYKHIGPHKCGQ